ncbi:Myxococcus cysteine-rich repeat-containing protein [Nannocystis exedens]|uniref:Myxococcus cysteine-rich repeat-containing protein n=1 Tax=Nannocystis exedens TaxID=54 RepID=A0A1I1WID4_9BACT|nr:DUF4215 domain-containing protein [Nannocystis exedens]PCC67740.1 hypothetical protein NAEX_00748 [Nannocystis exedens]SFD94759.1 Myxococcus cysteine-rich repeat-containing protein [Nannocystis exedens]
MVAPRALWVLLVLLSPACFSPSGTDTGSATDPATTTTTSGTTSSSTSTSTTTTTLDPTTSPTTGVDASTTQPGTTTTPDSSTTEPTPVTSTEPETTSTSTTVGPGFCGDGVVDGGEECDDANRIDTDDCVGCKFAVCGDGFVQAGVEACDDGNRVDTDACSGCIAAFCGDGVVQAGVEECDEDGDNCENCVRVYMRVFVSSVNLKSSLGGLDEADEKCQELADDAGLKGRFMAWLSTDSQAAGDRLEHSERPYKRIDGMPLADDWVDLVDGMLDNAIDRSEKNGKVGVGAGCGVCSVWTATSPQGAYFGDDCGDWNVALVELAGVGECTVPDARWTAGCAGKQCSLMAHLYCVEQSL